MITITSNHHSAILVRIGHYEHRVFVRDADKMLEQMEANLKKNLDKIPEILMNMIGNHSGSEDWYD